MVQVIIAYKAKKLANQQIIAFKPTTEFVLS